MSDRILEMTFDPAVINHLGIQMYSTLPPVIAELVSNSYDAEAKIVNIFLIDETRKKIIIEDDGHGMSYDEVIDKFLKIGMNRRKIENSQKSRNGKRFVIGKKGIGKLSFFGIAKNILIETVQNHKLTSFELDWEDLETQGKKNGKYEPKLLNKESKVEKKEGTKIVLSEISRKSKFDPENLAFNLSRSFQIFDEKDFKVHVFYNGSECIISPISNALKYRDIDEFLKWDFPITDDKVKYNYEYKNKINGFIIASKEKTVPSNMRGISLFSRGKLVNDYSFYDVKATSLGYSYITGWLGIDFIEEFDFDVISTNRQSLNWEREETAPLKEYLQNVIRSFYNEQREKKKTEKLDKIREESGIDIEIWLENLPKHERSLARKMIFSIINADGIEFSKSVELIRFTRDSFQFEAFKELARDLEVTGFEQPEKILDLLREWRIIESREMFKIAQVRLETIEKFENHIKSNSREVPELHNFLKHFPWLLDPRIMNFKDEVTYSELLKEHFDDSELQESDRRIDFLCQNFADSFFIIELKRPKKTISDKELDQALEYVSFIVNRLGNEYGRNVYCYLIGERLVNTEKTRMKAKAYRNDNLVYVKPYEELLSIAKNYHQEFIDKYLQLEQNV